MNERIAVITANVGRIDHVHPIMPQGLPFDFHLFTEENIIAPPDWDNRRKSKIPKMEAHRLLPDYDVYIWIDSSVRILNSMFVTAFMDKLKGHDMVVTRHPERKNIYDELNFMIKKIKAGDEYLSSRFPLLDIVVQKAFFKKVDFPESFPLFSAGIFARRNTETMNHMFDDWMMFTEQFGNYDQAFFSYLLHGYGIRYNTVNFRNPFFKVFSHPKAINNVGRVQNPDL